VISPKGVGAWKDGSKTVGPGAGGVSGSLSKYPPPSSSALCFSTAGVFGDFKRVAARLIEKPMSDSPSSSEILDTAAYSPSSKSSSGVSWRFSGGMMDNAIG
jgi:hypothetical protein